MGQAETPGEVQILMLDGQWRRTTSFALGGQQMRIRDPESPGFSLEGLLPDLEYATVEDGNGWFVVVPRQGIFGIRTQRGPKL